MEILRCYNCGLGEVSISENGKIFCSEKCLIEYKKNNNKRYKIDLDMEEIKRLYVEEKKSTLEIAKLMGTYKKMIRQRLLDMNIKLRSSGQSKSLYLRKNPDKNPFVKKSVKEKIKKTNLEKYGVEHNSQSEEYKESYRKTSFEKYGTEHPLQSKDVRQKINESRIDNFYSNLINSNRLKNSIVPMFSKDEYAGVDKKYTWKCVKCGNIFEDHLDDGHIPRCYKCYPKQTKVSKFENEIIEWLNSIDIDNIAQSENFMFENKKQEVDIYLPDYNLAIEFNGIYWHSESRGKDKNYHLNKTLECEKQGIELIHIFEDEWIEKRDIVKSIIKGKLGLNDKLYARKCEIREIKNQKTFLDENHLQGYIPSKVNIGLFYDDEIVSLLSFRKSRYNKKYDWEISRFANKLGLSIVGGFAKMLKYFQKNYPGSIITYSDRRWFDGAIYENNKFIKQKPSAPNYYYTRGLDRHGRQNFQKHKLEEKLEYFDPQLTEWENMQLNGWDRIWDCGNNIFVLN